LIILLDDVANKALLIMFIIFEGVNQIRERQKKDTRCNVFLSKNQVNRGLKEQQV